MYDTITDTHFGTVNVSYRWHHTATTPGTGLLLARSVRSWAESRRLLLARDYCWPVTPARVC